MERRTIELSTGHRENVNRVRCGGNSNGGGGLSRLAEQPLATKTSPDSRHGVGIECRIVADHG